MDRFKKTERYPTLLRGIDMLVIIDPIIRFADSSDPSFSPSLDILKIILPDPVARMKCFWQTVVLGLVFFAQD